MEISLAPLNLTKRVPLRISRGTMAGSTNAIVKVTHDGITGYGEMSPSQVTKDTIESAAISVERWQTAFVHASPLERETVLRDADILLEVLPGIGGRGGTGILAAFDIALWDWFGKRVGLPLYQVFGLDIHKSAETSVTVGINTPDAAADHAREWIARTGSRHLKIKLGSPDGIAADMDMYMAVLDAVDPNVVMRVDANCGWTESDARIMVPWLAERRVEYVEQPLACGDEESLAALRPAPVPIFLDESIHSATDVPKFAHLVDGVNVKLMKSGGISEAIRIVHTARAFGLQTMLGCMSESSLSIAAGVHIGPLFDHLDLDSHLNTADDPILGLGFEHGRVTQSGRPGLGVDVPEIA
jgi:muconate cycloisomerase